MSKNNRNHDSAFKARVALEAIKEEKTLAQLGSEYGVHPNQIGQWRKHLLEELPSLFSDKRKKSDKEGEELKDELYKEIGISRQCELIGLSRASYYYKPCLDAEEEHNRLLMRLIDEQFTKTPFYGSRNMTTCLKRQGHKVNRKRIRRLMQMMGLEAIYPKPNLSKSLKEHKKYPYLLRDIDITRRDQVWSTVITYIRIKQGFIYLVAVIDWYSRYVLSWEISTTLDK